MDERFGVGVHVADRAELAGECVGTSASWTRYGVAFFAAKQNPLLTLLFS